jgi:hypothetical protein
MIVLLKRGTPSIKSKQNKLDVENGSTEYKEYRLIK